MFHALMSIAARPLIAVWLAESRYSWRRNPVALDSPHVHAAGTDPDRILVTGDGISAGRGVITHDLGLPGFLAQDLTALTGRATDVDIVVSEPMTVATCRTAQDGLELPRFDGILLSVGVNEALALVSVDAWGVTRVPFWTGSRPARKAQRKRSSCPSRSAGRINASRDALGRSSTGRYAP
jgi:hypothetical protein